LYESVGYLNALLMISFIVCSSYLPSENVNAHEDIFISPGMAGETFLKQLPSLLVVAGSLDPLLDDSVVFVHRVRQWKEEYV